MQQTLKTKSPKQEYLQKNRIGMAALMVSGLMFLQTFANSSSAMDFNPVAAGDFADSFESNAYADLTAMNSQIATNIGFSSIALGQVRPITFTLNGGIYGEYHNFYLSAWKYQNGSPASSTAIGYSTSSNGPFTNSLGLNYQIATFNSWTSPTIYVKALEQTSQVFIDIRGDVLAGVSGDLDAISVTTALPTTTTSTLFAYTSDLAVGWTLNLRVKVANATANASDTFRITTSETYLMKFSTSPNGIFSDAIDVPIQMAGDGNGQTADFYVKGIATSAGYTPIPLITACASALPCIPAYPMRVLNVASVRFETYTDSSMVSPNIPLDNNPNAGGGLRIYPEKKAPSDNGDIFNRQYVTVVAKLSEPLSGKNIQFKVFDIDDPSSDDLAVDANGSLGNDNRSINYYFINSGTTKSYEKSTDANGEARVTLRVGQRPGDNYRVVATPRILSPNNNASNNLLDNVSVAGAALYYQGNPIPIGAFSTDPASATNFLTVWRRLHIERDSMGVVAGNFATGQITNVAPGALATRLSVTIPPVYSSALENGRYENGRILIYREEIPNSGSYYKVSRNAANTVYVHGNLSGHYLGWQFKIWDDDDFNNDDGENLDGDNGEDIPAPDLSLLQDSDSPAINKLAPAYIRPKYDLVQDNNVVFVANTPKADPSSRSPSNAELESLFRFDNIASEDDANFWTTYALNAYQDFLGGDVDPLTEGTVDGNGALGRNDGPQGQGFVIFMESIWEYHKYLIARGEPIQDRRKANAIALNEVGNLFGAADGEGGVMNDSTPCPSNCLDYSAATLNTIRNADHP